MPYANKLKNVPIEDIIAARERGDMLKEIAARYGVTEKAIYYHLGKAGWHKKYRFPAIHKYMLDRHLSQAEFGDRCGLSQTAVSQMMVGASNPSYETIMAVLNATGMTFEEAFHDA